MCTELDGSFVDCADLIEESAVIGKDIFNEQAQVYYNFEVPITILEFLIQFDIFECMCIDSLEPVVKSAEITDSKVLKAVFEIEHVHTSTVCNDVKPLMHCSLFKMIMSSLLTELQYLIIHFCMLTLNLMNVLQN